MTLSPLAAALDEAQFGGKAASLARSLAAGMPVPPGFALAATQVEAVFAGQPEALAELESAFIDLAGPCAVRSSAIGEDSTGASFAGQHMTILNVRDRSEVAAAVVRVRESARTESAGAYRRSRGIDEGPRVGVVVQRMIEPDCAGVMFTKHPLNGGDELVIEASWGLGEAVVAGLVIPDNYALDGGGRIVHRIAGEKDIAVRATPAGGTVEEPVANHLVAALCLSDEMLTGLYCLAVRCESAFGKGLDVEWAYADGSLYLLQCRPMTRNR